MNKSTWQRAKEIFDEARGLSDADRPEFLDRTCGGNAELRKQVDDLLAAYQSEFLEDTALGSAPILANPAFTNGQTIGRYRINELIGTGGMGQVFLADDTELDRPVAFKVLHSDVAEDSERVRRFIQEARAASALNHPNILTIHEIGSFEGSRYIVSEYVNGETLREKMRSGLNTVQSLEIACQIGAALDAAHSAGIVHRDIKPENVMIRHDGLVKVLDFGLAKLTEADDQPIDSKAPLSRIHTSPGLVMGTAAYMSPEQARGQAVDARTDLWSLGVVIHEMLTGRSPFEGESATELISSILSTETTPTDLASLPPELTPICQKALTKDKEKRYQSAHDLLKDLKGEKKRMEYAIQPTPFISTSNTDELKTQLIRPQRTLSAEYIVYSVQRHKYATLIIVSAVAFAAFGLSVYRYNGAPGQNTAGTNAQVIQDNTSQNDLKMSRFAVSGMMREAGISADGKYVAYITADGPGRNTIRIRQLDNAKDVEIVPAPPKGSLQNISFASDQIYYVLNTPNNEEIFRVPLAGGSSIKIADNTDGGGSLSPDGKLFAFQRDPKGETIYLANPDGTGERVLLDRPGDDWVYCGSVPAWSPDSKWLACGEHKKTKDEQYYQLVLLNVANGEIKARGDKKWRNISGSAFMPDGSLIIAAKETSKEELAPAQLWHVDVGGIAKQITNDLIGYSSLSATKTGETLLTLQTKTNGDIWTSALADPSKSRQITSSGEVWFGFNYTSSGGFLFGSNVSGNSDIWMMDSDGGNRRQLTAERGSHSRASISPDGRYIVYENRKDFFGTHVFRMDADGKNPIQLTHGLREWTPEISHDGKWVYYVRVPEPDDEPQAICKVSINGVDPVVVWTAPMHTRTWIHDISRTDGRLAFEVQTLRQPTPIRDLKVMAAVGGTPVSITLPPALRTAPFGGPIIRWSTDGRELIYSRRSDTTTVLNTLSTDGKASTRELVTLPGRISIYEFSPDGKQLGYVKVNSTSDAVLVTNKRN